MSDDLDPSDAHDHSDESQELELATQSQIFLAMREQNLELLRIATQVAGYSGTGGPVKHGDLKNAMKSIWDVYAEFYSWIDPEETGDDDEDEDE